MWFPFRPFPLFRYTFLLSLLTLPFPPRLPAILLGGHISLLPPSPLLFRLLPLPLLPLFLLPPLPCLLAEKILSALDLQIDLTLLSRGREGGVRLLALIRHLQRFLPLAQRALFEMRQEAVPVFVGEGGVGPQLALDHQFFDVVDGVDVGHAIGDHAADFLEARVRPHRGHRVPLHHDVSAGEELERFQRRPVGPQDPLPPLDKPFFVPHQVPDLDDIGCDAVVEDLHCLGRRHGPREELYQIPRFEDGGRVEGLTRCAHRHGTLDQVECACYLVGGEGARYEGPGGFEVGLTVFGKERCEGGFFSEGAGWVVAGVEWFDLKDFVKKILLRMIFRVVVSR